MKQDAALVLRLESGALIRAAWNLDSDTATEVWQGAQDKPGLVGFLASYAAVLVSEAARSHGVSVEQFLDEQVAYWLEEASSDRPL